MKFKSFFKWVWVKFLPYVVLAALIALLIGSLLGKNNSHRSDPYYGDDADYYEDSTE
ncbi:MAG: hypothetical protein ABI402_01710 [Ferruginibacter sp.]